MRYRPRHILPLSERQILASRVNDGGMNETPAFLVAPDVWVHAPQGSSGMAEGQAKDARIKAALDAGSPQDESKGYKRWRDKRVKELEEFLRKEVISRNDFHMKREDSSNYRKLVGTIKKQIQDPVRSAAERELQSLRREMDPDNPNAGKLSDLREDRRIAA